MMLFNNLGVLKVKTSNKKTILLIDDDDQFRKFMHELLTEKNFEVVVAENGETGLAHYLSEKPDLIITDIVMPEKEGIGLVIAIRDSDSSTPIIAVSGGNLGNADSYLDMAKKLGVNATLTKPFSADDILKEIHYLLSED